MKNITRMVSIILVLTIIMLLFSGCDVSPKVAYDNFITDLDILYRFEEIAFNIEFGRYSSVFQSDIKYLIRDLETLSIEDNRVKRINIMFLKSARTFLRASINYENDNLEHAQELHLYSIAKYEEALSAYHAFINQ